MILKPRIKLVEELPEIINKENVQRISNMSCALLNRNDYQGNAGNQLLQISARQSPCCVVKVTLSRRKTQVGLHCGA